MNRITDLPTISAVYNEISKAIDSDADIEKIGELAKQDPALSTKVLRIVNSPVFRSMGREITDVVEGVVRLGIMEFKKIVISLSVIETFNKFGNRLDYNKFWLHNLSGAFLTVKTFGLISGKNLGRRVSGELFTASLLHDIGIIILDHYFPDYYSKVIESGCHPASKRMLEVENKVLEINHEEVGEYIAIKWQLPDYVRAAIRYHHSIKDYQGKYEPIVRVVKIANEMCIMQKVIDNGGQVDIDQDKQERLKQKSKLYESMISGLQDDIERADTLLKLI